MRVIGYGLISVGWMGRAHARGISQVPDRYPELNVSVKKIIAADTLEAARKFALNSLGFGTVTSDYSEVINNPEVDVISICSPNFLHHEIAMAAIAAGKDFWIEKPMGRNEIESAEIATAVIKRSLITAVGFNYRQAPALAYARDFIRSGKLGTIYNVGIKLIADYVSDPEGAFTWRYEQDKAGSGVFGDLLSHGFDLAQYMVSDITEIAAQSEIFIKERREASPGASHFEKNVDGKLRKVENEDWAAGLLKFANGSTGTFESSRIAVGISAEYSIEVRGSLGTIRWDFEKLNELQIALKEAPVYGFTRRLSSPTDGEFIRFQPGRGTGTSFDDLKTVEAMLFLKSHLHRRQFAPSASDCHSTANVIAAAKRSISTGGWVSISRVLENRSSI